MIRLEEETEIDESEGCPCGWFCGHWQQGQEPWPFAGSTFSVWVLGIQVRKLLL